MSPWLAVLLILLVNLAWVGPVFGVLLHSRRTRLKGMVEVQAPVVHVRRSLTIQVTFDYPVRGGW